MTCRLGHECLLLIGDDWIGRNAKRTNHVRKCANLFEVNGALTPQKRRNVPIVEDFGPICKEFSS